MEARDESVGISDWALRQTSMEDVFLRIANDAEAELLIESDEGGLENDAKSPRQVAPVASPIEA